MTASPAGTVLRLFMILATASAGVALIWTGATIHNLGEPKLGLGILAGGAVVFLLAAQVEV